MAIEQEKFNTADNEAQKSKKFVFQVYPENIELVESLSYQEKNDFINQLFTDYRISSVINKKFNRSFNIAKKSIIIFIAAVIGIPVVFYLANISLHYTKISYAQMQKNFEKLY